MIQFHKKNPYMQLFLKELISRKSCTNCLFKCGKSSADLSLGDFWNLHKVAPHLDNSTGASMIIVHTELGFSVLQKCKWIHFETLPFDYVKTSNKAYFESMQANPLRDKYFAEFSASGKNWFSPDEYIQKKRKENFFKKIIKKLRGCLCYVK